MAMGPGPFVYGDIQPVPPMVSWTPPAPYPTLTDGDLEKIRAVMRQELMLLSEALEKRVDAKLDAILAAVTEAKAAPAQKESLTYPIYGEDSFKHADLKYLRDTLQNNWGLTEKDKAEIRAAIAELENVEAATIAVTFYCSRCQLPTLKEVLDANQGTCGQHE